MILSQNTFKMLFAPACRQAGLAFSVLLLALNTGCKKLVTVGPPSTSLVTTSVFNNDANAIAAQLGVYANLNQSGYEATTGVSSDEMTSFATDQTDADIYHNNLNAQNEAGAFFWSSLYTYIYQENAILENAAASTGMSSRVKQLQTGEALFMRAWFYFQLVNMYGDVPLVLSTDYTKTSILPRTPVANVYQQMITDLTTAQGLLSPTYIDGADNTGSTDRVRPTTWAADALLARVYLYKGDYANAAKQASLVIANSGYSLLSTANINNVFKMNSSEAIWQLMPPSTQLYTNEGQFFILKGPPFSSGGLNGGITISPQLLAAFEPNDARKTNWIGTFVSGGVTYYFPYKYKASNTATSLTEYSMVLRLAEQYLIRAEAEANNSDPSDAVNDLNMIRNRAGLPNYLGATDVVSLNTAIMHERQVELFTEEHRWFDLKRTKTIDAVMGVVTPQKGGGSWNSFQQLYPLLVTDLQFNPNLVQNPGY